jgi:hypothetical protein
MPWERSRSTMARSADWDMARPRAAARVAASRTAVRAASSSALKARALAITALRLSMPPTSVKWREKSQAAVSTPVCAEVSIAVMMPVAKACGTSACCTTTGLAPRISASRVSGVVWARKRLPRRSSSRLSSERV